MNKLKNFEMVIFSLLILGIAGVTSCIPDSEENFDVAQQFEDELADIDIYLETNLIDADTDSISLIRYVMIEEGTGEMPELTDSVNITYEGRFLTDVEFDSGTRTFRLNSLIGAWQIMLPRVKEGGTIEFYAPSYYCYGPNGRPGIPSNSTLIFKITLHAVKPSS